MRPEAMSKLEQFRAQLREVVNLAVEDNPYRTVLVRHRLMPGRRQIQNGKAPAPEYNSQTFVRRRKVDDVAIVGSSMELSSRHPLDAFARAFESSTSNYSRDPAHQRTSA
jgi:hypothetical protein